MTDHTSLGVRIFGGTACGDLLTPQAAQLATEPGARLFHAVSQMRWARVGAIPVVAGGRLVGRLSEDDILGAVSRRLDDADPEAALEPLWQGVLEGVQVADVMAPRGALAIVVPEATVLDGVRAVVSTQTEENPLRYVFLESADGTLRGLVSFRDLSRFLTDAYDGTAAAGLFADDERREDASKAARSALDTPLSACDSIRPLGHEPIVIRSDAGPAEILHELFERRRGYVLACSADGAPMGICTRRDVLHALCKPFARLDRMPLINWVRGGVTSATMDSTLCGLFKLMALGRFRHLPVVGADESVERVISMSEAVAWVAGVPTKL